METKYQGNISMVVLYVSSWDLRYSHQSSLRTSHLPAFAILFNNKMIYTHENHQNDVNNAQLPPISNTAIIISNAFSAHRNTLIIYIPQLSVTIAYSIKLLPDVQWGQTSVLSVSDLSRSTKQVPNRVDIGGRSVQAVRPHPSGTPWTEPSRV